MSIGVIRDDHAGNDKRGGLLYGAARREGTCTRRHRPRHDDGFRQRWCECDSAVSVRFGGSISEKMNARAAELHMMQTHFVTPSGLDAEGTAPWRMTWRCLPQKRCKMKVAAAVGQTTLSVRLFRPKKPCGMKMQSFTKAVPGLPGHQNGLYEKGRALPCVFRRAGTAHGSLCDIKCPGRLERPHEFVRLRLCTACRARTYTAGFQPISLPLSVVKKSA